MRLKKIRLAGFKSFVDATNIPFPGDMTAIVGPNGCGKSNVIDAVRWVLGESSAKNLRGDAMTDVIFNGSTARKAVGQCSVELVFDNSSGRIQGEFAAFNEISVKRIVTQEAVSSYWLNGTKCRRRDITDLFLGTGLGPRSYAIIEQGMISKLIESKPQELRIFIEEAAGISKYKERRKETVNRIGHTKENLERLEDVRQELGDQLAKLKRQAQAATRYKELKQSERQLKAELATIKWLSQSRLMQEVQSQIDDKQMALANLQSGQQGDESGLQALKNQQSMTKQEIDDKQQALFKLGTEITKLEQSQLFAKKRSVQIQSEIEHIKQDDSSLQIALNSIVDDLEIAQEQVYDAEPEREIIQAQLLELEDDKSSVDEKLRDFLLSNKNKDEQYYSKKQALQQKHSQIQQTLNSQERTQTRISQLSAELISLNDEELALEAQQASQQLSTAEKTIQEREQLFAEASVELEDIKQKVAQAQNHFDNAKQLLMGTQAKLDALYALQADNETSEFKEEVLEEYLQEFASNALDQNDDKGYQCKAVWQYFQIEKGYEQALHSALSNFDGAWVLNAPFSANASQWHKQKPTSVLFEHEFTNIKKPNTLAAKLSNSLVPDVFNKMLIVDSEQEAAELRKTLKNDNYIWAVISQNGIMYTTDAYIAPNLADNKLARGAQIEELSQQKLAQNNALETHQQSLSISQHKLVQKSAALDTAKDELAIAKNDVNHWQMVLQNIEFKQTQFAQQNEKLNSELKDEKERLSQDEMSLELLSEQVEDLAIELAELEEGRDTAAEENEQLQARQQSLQIQYNQLQAKVHQQELSIQQLQNSLKILREQQHNKQNLLSNNQDKLLILQDEAEDLLMPEQDQQERLQTMLLEQSELRVSLQDKQEQLSDIEQDIIDLEKGQQGLKAKMDGIKAEIESLRIRYESANVRAQAFIEQLAELNQSLKDILQTLPENAQENKWQEDLDKVSTGISRLGAVNLAAVDEYEEQAVRKQHLDDQNQDLTDALTTLENAMRKIDKETRTRFKHTYDQVNGDLKMLFPKVFGGGSAYLELTGEDLLETGVTIMARPPGKKNSTIHLLSGGEKALTALSLVFAIFRLNPAPFCLLDEVDAPLDDANVGRFCRLVSEMSQSVQFIYITHNKVAMEMASHLTGVTMAEPGVSRMVAVDMEEALAIAE